MCPRMGSSQGQGSLTWGGHLLENEPEVWEVNSQVLDRNGSGYLPVGSQRARMICDMINKQASSESLQKWLEKETCFWNCAEYCNHVLFDFAGLWKG